MRTGVITQKVGMTRLFLADGTHVPVTVLKLDGCAVIGTRTKEKDGYTAVQLGSGFAKPKNASKAERGQFAKAEMEPRKKVAEFRIDEDAMLEGTASPRLSTSRLSCQLVMTPEMDGLVVDMPEMQT